MGAWRLWRKGGERSVVVVGGREWEGRVRCVERSGRGEW